MALTKIDDRGLKTPIDLLDNEKIRLGTGNDIELSHDGTNSILNNTTGELQVTTDGIMRFNATEYKFNNAANNEIVARFEQDGTCELYHNHSKKLETTTDGVQVTGEVVSGTLHCSGKLDLPDSSGATVGRVLFGDSDDLQIYHNGSNSYLRNSTGIMHVGGSSSGDLVLESGGNVRTVTWTGESMIEAKQNGAVELYYDNSKKFETNSNGCLLGDSTKLQLGGNADLQIYHNGSSGNYIDSVNKDLYLRCNLDAGITGGDIILQPKSGEDSAIFRDDGAVELYYDNAKKFETTSTGATVTGTLRTTNMPYAMVGRGSTQSVPNTTGTTIVFDTEAVDRGNDYDTSTGIFTCPIDGDYLVCLLVQYTANVNQCHSGIYKNNGTLGTAFDPWVNNGDDQRAATMSVIISCSANDNLRGVTYQGEGSSQLLEAGRCKMTIRYLG